MSERVLIALLLALFIISCSFLSFFLDYLKQASVEDLKEFCSQISCEGLQKKGILRLAFSCHQTQAEHCDELVEELMKAKRSCEKKGVVENRERIKELCDKVLK